MNNDGWIIYLMAENINYQSKIEHSYPDILADFYRSPYLAPFSVDVLLLLSVAQVGHRVFLHSAQPRSLVLFSLHCITVFSRF